MGSVSVEWEYGRGGEHGMGVLLERQIMPIADHLDHLGHLVRVLFRDLERLSTSTIDMNEYPAVIG